MELQEPAHEPTSPDELLFEADEIGGHARRSRTFQALPGELTRHQPERHDVREVVRDRRCLSIGRVPVLHGARHALAAITATGTSPWSIVRTNASTTSGAKCPPRSDRMCSIARSIGQAGLYGR